jgi:hypothetical protein
MKKISVLVLTLLLALSLTACGGSDSTPSGDTPLTREDNNASAPSGGDAASDYDMGAILSGNGDSSIIGGMPEADKQAFIDDATAAIFQAAAT